MAETPEARWQRLERQAARDPVASRWVLPRPRLGLWVITPNVFRLSVDSRRPELGQIDTYVCRGATRIWSGKVGRAVAGC
jgi:hypothetical protein